MRSGFFFCFFSRDKNGLLNFVNDYSVHYSDYASAEYSAVSLEEVTDGLIEAGAIDESCISYVHVENFRKIRDDQYADDNEFDPDDIFP